MNKMTYPLVLMYHGIVSKEFGTPAYREVGAELYDVPQINFKKQMECLKESGYNVSVFDELSVPGELSGRSERGIFLTFDDGEANNFHNAFPVLRNLGRVQRGTGEQG